MPTYDYECSACGHRFEQFEKLSEPGTKPCPKCKKGKAKRMPGHGAGFIFKGSGFHVTDYRSPSHGGGEPAKKKTTRKEKEKKPESKSESKE